MEESVLIVDNDSAELEILAELMADLGYSYQTTNDCFEAVEKLNGQQITLLISRTDMPGMTGFQLLEHVKEHHPATDVILAVDAGSPSDCRKAIQQGAFDYISRPFQPEEISARLLRAARERGLVRELNLQVAARNRVESELQEGKALFQTLVENSPT